MEVRCNCCLYMLVGCLMTVASYSTAFSQDYFTAAVYEHARHDKWKIDSPADVMLSNLKEYERAVAVAKYHDADLILFPEYGIVPPIDDRLKLKKYLEVIPNPQKVRVTPCDELKQYSRRPILFALSCMAKRNKIVVVANIGAREPCHDQPDCPKDGEFHFNANVAFDQNGTLVGRYYKEHLFYEPGLDLPKEKQNPIIKTEFGNFAMFICFDIMFKKMVVMSQQPDIDAILFSTMWFNSSPFYTSIQWWQAWAMGNNATMLTANMQIPGYGATGSGVYYAQQGSIVSAFNPDGISKLVVSTIPKRNRKVSIKSNIIAITKNEIKEWDANGKDLPPVCSYNILGETENITYCYRCIDQDNTNYVLKKLVGAEGHVKVCSNGMCCELDYSADSMNENYYLGVFNGTRTFFKRYFLFEENCFLAKCDDVNGTSCSLFAMYSKTVFRKILMKANFSTKYIYPSMMSSGMELVPVRSWAYTRKFNKASIEFVSSSGIRLIQATLLGRIYDKDPPYVP